MSSLGAVGVTLRCHPECQANAFSSSGINTNGISEIKSNHKFFLKKLVNFPE